MHTLCSIIQHPLFPSKFSYKSYLATSLKFVKLRIKHTEEFLSTDPLEEREFREDLVIWQDRLQKVERRIDNALQQKKVEKYAKVKDKVDR
jgi:hypothetical protein